MHDEFPGALLVENALMMVFTSSGDVCRSGSTSSSGLHCHSSVSAKASASSSVINSIPRAPWIGGMGARCFFLNFTALQNADDDSEAWIMKSSQRWLRNSSIMTLVRLAI
ncbi:hypothetical protein Trydic_g15861 [Trypoxylus dichotomus]